MAGVGHTADDTKKALAISTDCTPRYCFADPVEGGKQAIAEAWRNITAVGATPLAVTNCLNFANPQRPDIMGQFVGSLEGMGAACIALDFPIVSGNVSLYNESKATGGGSAILPTPAIGGVGLLADYGKMATLAFKAADETILVIGETKGHLGQSIWLREIAGQEDGPPPPVDLAGERRNGDFVRGLIADGKVSAVHDCADGGLLVAVTEMALAGNIGAILEPDAGIPLHAWAFGEDQARYVVTSANGADIAEAARAAGVPVAVIGRTGGDSIALAGTRSLSLSAIREAHESFFPRLMSSETTL